MLTTIHIYIYIRVCGGLGVFFLFILRLHVCLMKALPYRLCCCRIMCVRLHQYDTSLMWKYKEQKPSQPQSGPQRDTSTTVHVHTCVFECVWLGENERERQRARWGETENTESHKPQQAPKVTTASMFFNYPSTREATVCGPNISCAKGTADSAAKRKQYCA